MTRCPPALVVATLLLVAAGCDPYADWPEPGTYFPYVYTPEDDLKYYADPHFMVLARELIAAGADLIVGQGAHVLQPPEICYVNWPEQVPGIGTCSVRSVDEDEEPRTAAVLYSLGNFGTAMGTIPCQTGMVATVTLDGHVVTGLGWSAAATIQGDDGPELRPLDQLLDDPDHAAEMERLDAHLGTGWKR